MKKVALLFLLVANYSFLHAQFVLSGKVVDENQETLTGANISVKGTYLGSVSDNSGEFKISGLKEGKYTLQISFIGYQTNTKEVTIEENKSIVVELEPQAILSDEVIVEATRLGNDITSSYSTVSKEELASNNLGQDLPFLLSSVPGVVQSSDAGAGVGYSSIWIRGSDITRINVTVNGIPLNDAESQGVYWVNMPDFASGLNSIQVQRGVGTSSNGAGAFGATINLESMLQSDDAFAKLSNSYGSFNTQKYSIIIGTGLLGGHFSFEGRASRIYSDGFIDRATSDLKSYYLQGGYYTEKTFIKAITFSGKEKTYQAWWGVPKVRLENDLEGMQRYEDHWLYTPEQTEQMISSDARTYNYYTYDNETDNYKQDHYQLHLSHQVNKNLLLNTALHYTHGEGYYEQFKKDDKFSNYGLQNIMTSDTLYSANSDTVVYADTIKTTDLVRQKWLDNDFYGVTWSVKYRKNNLTAVLGGAYNEYKGGHFGNIIWMQNASNATKDYEWYNNDGTKTNFNLYGKVTYTFYNFSSFIDLQYRRIGYNIKGIHDDFRNLSLNKTYDFINPKFGFKYQINNKIDASFSYALANREPNRSNFRDAESEDAVPQPEELHDFELGMQINERNYTVGANLYYMYYVNQLVSTGKINDVGAAILTNVDVSYRRGIEIFGSIKPVSRLLISSNLVLSQNMIKDFTEYVDSFDADWNWSQHASEINLTNISFSPSIVAGNLLQVEPIDDLKIGIQSKYVGKQYIDNSSDDNASLDPYFVNDLLIGYSFNLNGKIDFNLNLKVNNLLNEEYETWAWVYKYYLEGELYNMDGYFPQAGTNFLLGLTVEF